MCTAGRPNLSPRAGTSGSFSAADASSHNSFFCFRSSNLSTCIISVKKIDRFEKSLLFYGKKFSCYSVFVLEVNCRLKLSNCSLLGADLVSYLKEQGTLGALREKWFEGTSVCGAQGEEGSSAPGLTFDNIGGIFYLVAGGALLSIIINFMENVWFKFMRLVFILESFEIFNDLSWWANFI